MCWQPEILLSLSIPTVSQACTLVHLRTFSSKLREQSFKLQFTVGLTLIRLWQV